MNLFSKLKSLWSPPVYEHADSFEVLDVRTDTEFQLGHVARATHMDVLRSDFTSRIQTLDKHPTYKVYCKSGVRSSQAVSIMKSCGFKDVENIGGLSRALTVLNRPCVKTTP